jgi:hypothetical protein
MNPSRLRWATTDAFDYAWTEKAYDLLVERKITAVVMRAGVVETSVVNGPCPRCEHVFSASKVRTAVTDWEGTLGESADERDPGAAEFVEVDLWCECDDEHPGRPDGRTGCGAAYRVPATREVR